MFTLLAAAVEATVHTHPVYFGGTLVSDDYAVYHALQPRHRQSCLAHPLRLAKEITEQLDLLRPQGVRHPQAERFLDGVRTLLKQACAAGAQTRPNARCAAARRRLAKQLRRRLDRLCATPLCFAPAETLRQRLHKERNALFTFLRYPGVEPTNNHAEQSLRASVIMRKITFGNRSAAGAEAHSILTSLLHTARRQGKNVREFFRVLLLADTTTAQAALYNNSS